MHRNLILHALFAASFVREDLVYSGNSDEDVDNLGDGAGNIISDAVSEGFQEPVQTADNEKYECDLVKFHILRINNNGTHPL